MRILTAHVIDVAMSRRVIHRARTLRKKYRQIQWWWALSVISIHGIYSLIGTVAPGVFRWIISLTDFHYLHFKEKQKKFWTWEVELFRFFCSHRIFPLMQLCMTYKYLSVRLILLEKMTSAAKINEIGLFTLKWTHRPYLKLSHFPFFLLNTIKPISPYISEALRNTTVFNRLCLQNEHGYPRIFAFLAWVGQYLTAGKVYIYFLIWRWEDFGCEGP